MQFKILTSIILLKEIRSLDVQFNNVDFLFIKFDNVFLRNYLYVIGRSCKKKHYVPDGKLWSN
jgi:hypothetical protein